MNKLITPILAILAMTILPGCIGVGTRVCALHQPGCDFTDKVLSINPSGTLCPTWNVQFANYNQNGKPTDTFAIQQGRDDIVAILRNATENDHSVHVWYAGENFVFYAKCSADYPLVIYDAKLEES